MRSGQARRTLKMTGVIAPLLLAGPAAAGSLTFNDFTDVTGLSINADAQQDTGLLRLTNSYDQVGSVFTENKVVDPTKRIRTRFRVHVHDAPGQPADGMVFVIHRDPRGAAAFGAGGHRLGYAGTGPDDEIQRARISKSIGVDLNLNFSGDSNFVGLLKNGRLGRRLAKKNMDIYDRELNVWVNYSPRTKRLKVFVSANDTRPANPKISERINLNRLFDGRKAYAGFTGATGGEMAVHDVLSWRLRNP